MSDDNTEVVPRQGRRKAKYRYKYRYKYGAEQESREVGLPLLPKPQAMDASAPNDSQRDAGASAPSDDDKSQQAQAGSEGKAEKSTGG
jgi:hypothetical protein